jgi:hypothetical protein
MWARLRLNSEIFEFKLEHKFKFKLKIEFKFRLLLEKNNRTK